MSNTDKEKNFVASLSQFPTETLTQIYSNLKGDNASLFSCMLISCGSCRIVIPILWSNALNRRFNNRASCAKLINTLLNFLNKDERDQLPLHIFDTNPKEPLFNYVDYITELNFERALYCVKQWSWEEPQKSKQLSLKDLNFVGTQLFESIFRSSKCLSGIFIQKWQSSYHLPNFTQNQIDTSNLSGLANFQLYGDPEYDGSSPNIATFVESLALIAQNIQSLNFNFDNLRAVIQKPMLQLITVQKNLRHLILENTSLHLKQVFSIISTPTSLLRRIEFHLCTVPAKHLDVLSDCPQLDAMIFSQSLISQGDRLTKNLRLKKLGFIGSARTMSGIIPLIEKTFNTLEQLIIPYECDETTIKDIFYYCRNLTAVSIPLETGAILTLTGVLQSLHRIRELCLRPQSFTSTIASKQQLCSLAYSFPTSLISVKMDTFLDPAEMQNFLKSCPHQLKRFGVHVSSVEAGHLSSLINLANMQKAPAELSLTNNTLCHGGIMPFSSLINLANAQNVPAELSLTHNSFCHGHLINESIMEPFCKVNKFVDFVEWRWFDETPYF